MIKDIKAQNENTKPNDGVLRKLNANFPQCFTKEGKFDLERFQLLIENEVDVTKEGYELNFLGKNYANLIASTETETVIRPDLAHNSLPENIESQNVYISGDNLDALKHLLKSYSGKIKCIYIDPPYNTGSDGFVYNDKFNFTAEQLQTKLSISEEKANKILDLTKRGSASHSAWLMFMAPRLMLAKDLLTEDGVIFISIDDNEQANLKLLCDNVFGEENLLGELIVQTATDNNATQINTEHEYMVCYANSKEVQKYWHIDSIAAKKIQEQYLILKGKGLSIAEIESELRLWIKKNKENLPQVTHYNNVDEKGVYSNSTNSSNTKPGGYTFDIIHPITGKPCPKPAYGWRWPEETFLEYKAKDDIEWGKDETTQPHVKKRLETAVEQLKTIIYEDGRASTKLLEILFGAKKIFDNPKPLNTLVRILKFVSEEDSVILDFFSGSSTTAHAVMKLNSEDNGNRRYIMVQLTEQTPKDSEARKAGFETIDQIGQERIRRAAAKIKEENPLFAGDLGFKHYILQDIPQNTLDRLEAFDPNGLIGEEDILDKFGKDTVLETWCVKDGYGFGANKVELKLADYSVYQCGSHLYFISGEGFDENSIIALIDKYNSDPSFNPQNVVLFGYSFSFTQVEMLKKNLNTLKDSAKNLNINLDIRY